MASHSIANDWRMVNNFGKAKFWSEFTLCFKKYDNSWSKRLDGSYRLFGYWDKPYIHHGMISKTGEYEASRKKIRLNLPQSGKKRGKERYRKNQRTIGWMKYGGRRRLTENVNSMIIYAEDDKKRKKNVWVWWNGNNGCKQIGDLPKERKKQKYEDI